MTPDRMDTYQQFRLQQWREQLRKIHAREEHSDSEDET